MISFKLNNKKSLIVQKYLPFSIISLLSLIKIRVKNGSIPYLVKHSMSSLSLSSSLARYRAVMQFAPLSQSAKKPGAKPIRLQSSSTLESAI